MNSIIKENVIISPPDQGKKETDIRNVDMKNQKDVINEIERLKCLLMKWNIHADIKPRPVHIKIEDYETRAEYQQAKDDYYKDYNDTCRDLNDNIKNLQGINTQLCFDEKKEEDEIKIAQGNFYTADEQKIIDEKRQQRQIMKDKRQCYNAKSYDKNKEKNKRKKNLKKIKQNKISVVGIDPKMVRKGVAIKPLCQCGRLCNVHDMESMKEHSVIEKHNLFKSVIKLIHYKRKTKKIKPVIDKINNDYNKFKTVERVEVEGKSITLTNKTDKDIIKLYKDYIRPFDENLTHKPREAYMEKVEYTEEYKDSVLELRNYNHYLTRACVGI
tara:strand:+ start:1022 stop:2005 length:984 start_codon:yes stop_codon:yes gene_type:complete